MSGTPREYIDRLREAAVALRTVREERDALLGQKNEPIAVVGMACRFPGGADDPARYWDFLLRGGDAVVDVVGRRWPEEALPEGQPEARWAGLLDGIDRFEPSFFMISPREAEFMDPQQRLLLEVSWEALENAGIPADRLEGSRTGVFVGVSSVQYAELMRLAPAERVDAYAVTGGGASLSMVAGRISYTFGFQGPAVAMDTACASSLVGIHLACQSLRNGDSDLALAGGVNLLVSPWVMTLLTKLRALSPDGRCKTFDARANGFVRGEGCGIVVLKRLSDARRDDDRILAIVRGSALNQDGRSSGFTAPNVLAQESLIRAALANAQVAPEEIGFVEAHGTGTSLGDPIELEALKAAIGKPRKDGSRALLGAVKTNLGHLESASGVASFMKVVLALQHGAIPGNLHFRGLNPRVSFEDTSLAIPTEVTPWPRAPGRRRVAGVSAFGLSGTNAHMVLEEAPESEARELAPVVSSYLLPLSAKTPESLAVLARTHAELLAADDGNSLQDIVHTASVRRMHHDVRLAVVGRTRNDMARALEAHARGEIDAGVVQGAVTSRRASAVVFVFSGQGSQWVGMGRQLLDEEPVFREAFSVCDTSLTPHTGFSVIEELRAPEERTRLTETVVAQPVLFAFEVALAALLKSFGIVPRAVLGHSVGEIAAAHVAGILELDQAARLVALRAQVMQKATGQGKMVSIALREEAARRVLEGVEDRVGIAAINGPGQVVISGDTAAVDGVVERLTADGVRCRPLPVNYAFHSPQMELLRGEFVQALGAVVRRPGTIPMISTVTGDVIDPDALDASYWGDNIRQGVQFVRAVERAIATDRRLFVEVGPHAVLTQNVEEIVRASGADGAAISTMRRKKDERQQVLLALGALYVQGQPVEWKSIHPGGGRLATLPTYPWQRKRYWIDAAPPSRQTSWVGAPSGHHLLGEKLSVAGAGAVYESSLEPTTLRYLADHRVFDEVVAPGVALVEMACAAGSMHTGADACRLVSFTIQAPLQIAEGTSRRLQAILSETTADGTEVAIYSQPSNSNPDEPWLMHAKGVVQAAFPAQHVPPLDLQAIRARCTTPLGVDDIYGRLRDVGVDLGPSFRGIVRLWKGPGEALAQVKLPAAAGDDPRAHRIHPALLDAALQTLAGVVDIPEGRSYLPFEFSDVVLWARHVTEAWVHTRLVGEFDPARESFTLAVTMAGEDGRILATMSDVRIKRASTDAVRRAVTPAATIDCMYSLAWQERPFGAAGREPAGAWLLVNDGSPLVAELEERIRVAGGRGVVVTIDEFVDRYDDFIAVGGAPRGVLYLGGAESAAENAAIPDLAERAAISALRVAQTMAKRGAATRLWFVTRGALRVENEAPSPAYATWWGLGRTILAEHPELGLKLVDLGSQVDGALDALWQEVCHADDVENQIAWRGGKRLVARLVKADVGRSLSREVAKGGTVLVTGGLGALGREVARWLWEEQRAAHIVLVGRRPPAGESAADVERLRAAGARVTVVQADVSVPEEAAALVAGLPADVPLHGVIHAAGVLDDGILTEQDERRIANVFAPKVRGVWNLHQATRALDLDFFVLFSSASSVLGNAGQSNYAAANAFLDALAHTRRAEGLPALSLNWGPWARGGMAASLTEARRARFSRMGVGILEPAQALRALGQALTRSDTQFVVTPLDLQGLERASEGRVSPLWGVLVRPKTAPSRAPSKGAWIERLATLSASARVAEVDAALRADIAKVLSLQSPGEVPEDRPLQELGLDSLIAVELRNAVAARMGTSLPATLLFDYPSLRALRAHLLERLAPVEAKPPVALSVSARRAPAEDAIAIVGIGCRFPGGIRDPEGFWRLLEQGIDAIREVPPGRWDIDAYYDPDPDAAGKMTSRWGGFVDDIDRFDASFFGISPREARSIDPQQRLLLETTWEALEDAGIPAERLLGSDTGVYVGITGNDYQSRTLAVPEQIDAYSVLGTQHATTVGRLSYWLGLQGPNVAIDTACSSALVSVHLASRALMSGECSLALAGGVNVVLWPEVSVFFSRMKAMSPTGRCHAFSADADGYVRSDGCAMLVLKRASDALRDGDPILALVRGSAVNQDGRSQGLTAPNGPAQQAVIRAALHVAGLRPSDIDYVETHGTGTPLGDPIEVQSLGATYGDGRAPTNPLVIGSVKTNIGHTEGAAGAAGLAKTLLALKHGAIPPSLHFTTPNPRIDWSALPVKVAAETMAWPATGKPRLAGVSSFGASGTNAHVILEEPPVVEVKPLAKASSAHHVLLSAKSPEALTAMARSHGEWLSRAEDISPRDLSYTTCVRRTHHEHRLSGVAGTREELAAMLASFARGEVPAGLVQGSASSHARPKVVFVFPGQGSQWLGMGRTLLADEPAFRSALEACDAAIREEAGFSVLEELSANEAHSRLAEIDVVQPVLFAMAVALAALWRSSGVEPDCVVGHSMGEVAAAHVAGMLSLREAVKVACRRSRLLRRISGKGAMGLVELPMAEAEAAIAGYESVLGVAVSNGPRSSVLSGDPAALEAVLGALEQKGVFCRRVKVDVASHSPQVDPLREDLLSVLADVHPSEGQTPMRSTVTGAALHGDELRASYWWDNLRQPVRFSEVTRGLMDEGHALFVEMSPHPILLPSVEENFRASKVDGAAIASVRRHADESRSMLEALGALHVRGYPVDWAKRFPEGGRVVALPTYPWQREKHWISPVAPATNGGATASMGERGRAHPLLGDPLQLAIQPGSFFWETRLVADRCGYLGEYRVDGRVVFPLAAFVEMVLAASREALRPGVEDVIVAEDVEIHAPLVLTKGEVARVQCAFTIERNVGTLRMFSAPAEKNAAASGPVEWQLAASARVRVERAANGASARCVLPPSAGSPISLASTYASMARVGLEHGPALRSIDSLERTEEGVVARLRLPGPLVPQAKASLVHPCLLDGAFQSLSQCSASDVLGGSIPGRIESVRFHGSPGEAVVCLARRTNDGAGEVLLVDDQGRHQVEVHGLTSVRVERVAPQNDVQEEEAADERVLEVRWEEAALDAAQAASGARRAAVSWILLMDQGGVCASLRAHLEAKGDRVIALSREAAGDLGWQDKLVAELRLLEGDKTRLRGVVCGWPLDVAPLNESAADAIHAAGVRLCAEVLACVGAIERARLRDQAPVWLMTRGAQRVCREDTSISVVQAMIWGLGRALRAELAGVDVRRLDFEPTSVHEPELCVAVASELEAEGLEDEIALRGNQRFVSRLGPFRAKAGQEPDKLRPSAPRPRPGGVYLVAGASKERGLVSAGWLAALGAERIVLALAPQSQPPEDDPTLSALRGQGVDVTILPANAADEAQIASVFQWLDDREEVVLGVVHAPHVARDDHPMDAEALRKATADGVAGAWNLHRLTKHRPLEWFVLQASVACTLDMAARKQEAAVGAFLEALAIQRRDLGLCGLTIGWGPLRYAPAASDEPVPPEQLGLDALDASEGVDIFARLFAASGSYVVASALDPRRWVDFHPTVTALPRLRFLVEQAARRRRETSEQARLLMDLRAAGPGERIQLLEQAVRGIVAAVLRMDPERIGRQAVLKDFGLDSLMSLEMRNRLESTLGLTLSATLLWAHPTIAALAAHLVEKLSLDTAPKEPVVAAVESSRSAAVIEDVPEDFDVDGDAAALLEAQLASIEEYLDE